MFKRLMGSCAVAMGCGMTSCCVSAVEFSLVSGRDNTVVRSANTYATLLDMSADGEWTLYQTEADDAVADGLDGNGASDVFLFRRSTQTRELISKSWQQATRAANGASSDALLSDNGRFVVYSSTATDVMPGLAGVHDGFSKLYLLDRNDQSVRLVSHPVGQAMTIAVGTSIALQISADGRFVLYGSSATNLVAGQNNGGAHHGLFLYDRNSDTSVVVSHAVGQPTVLASDANDAGQSSAFMSETGDYVYFSSVSAQLVSAISDTAGLADVFLYNRQTGQNLLVTRNVSAAASAGGLSAVHSISSDGRFALLSSDSTTLVAASDGNGAFDAFLYDRQSNQIALVSHAAGQSHAANAMTYPVAISPDGQQLLLSSLATNLVAGVTDQPDTGDLFVHQRVGGARKLVTRVANAPQTALGNGAQGRAINNTHVAFAAQGALRVGDLDLNLRDDLFSFDIASEQVTLLTPQYGVANYAAGADFEYAGGRGLLSQTGFTFAVATKSALLDAQVTDANRIDDVFLFRHDASPMLVSRAASVSVPHIEEGTSMPRALSPSGSHMLFDSDASDVAAGVPAVGTGGNAIRTRRTLLKNLDTGVVRLVSGRLDPYSSGGTSFGVDVNDNGAVLFDRTETFVDEPMIDLNQARDVYYRPSPDDPMQLVSKSDNFPGSTANGESRGHRVCTDGSVLFGSTASDLVAGVADTNASADLFHYAPGLATSSLLTRAAASPSLAANGPSTFVEASADCRWVLFDSEATDLVVGADTNNASDVFLLDRDMGTVELISRNAGNTAAAAGTSHGFGTSTDGRWVLFSSTATDVRAGISDSNGVADLYLRDRQNGSVKLVSHAVGLPLTTANAASTRGRISADGLTVVFVSRASDLIVSPYFPYDENLFTTSVDSDDITLAARCCGSGGYGNVAVRDLTLSPNGSRMVFSVGTGDLNTELKLYDHVVGGGDSRLLTAGSRDQGWENTMAVLPDWQRDRVHFAHDRPAELTAAQGYDSQYGLSVIVVQLGLFGDGFEE